MRMYSYKIITFCNMKVSKRFLRDIFRKDLVREKKFASVVEWSPDKSPPIINDQKTKFCNRPRSFSMDTSVLQKSDFLSIALYSKKML
jgi:hypothetical protein